MKFEFDAYKSESNKAKHGLDFIEAQALWQAPRLEVAKREQSEMRYSVIGTIRGSHYTAIISYRGPTVRIISARKSEPKEITLYEHHKK